MGTVDEWVELPSVLEMSTPNEPHRDQLPEDLDVTGFVGPYLFPDNTRRRWPGALYIVSGLVMLGTWLARSDHPIFVNRGIAVGGALLILLGIYHLLAGVHLAVKEVDALTSASKSLGFAVGHASAQLGWRGIMSRPTWRILMYSAEEPPKQRAMALVDGVDATVIGQLVQDNPEDWSVFEDAGKLTERGQ